MKHVGSNLPRLGIGLGALLTLLLAAHGLGNSLSGPQVTEQTEVKKMVSNMHWLGHASFRIEGDDLVIYIDPWKLEDGPKADLILTTHNHPDHLSPEDVAKIQKKDSIIVTVSGAAAKLSGQIEVVRPGDEVTVRGIPVRAVPAYNVNKFRSPGVPFHPRESGYVGFVFTLEGQRIYHVGDTDSIPEMGSLDVDIALLPVSGTYVMTADEAVEAAKTIQPQVTIPIHIGRGIGSLADADPLSNKVTLTTSIQTSADLSITKSSLSDPVFAGESLTYTINVMNSGPSDAVNVVITETYDANFIFSRSTPSPDSGTTNQWTFASIAVGNTETISITGVVDPSTLESLSNTVSLTSDTADPDPTNNTTGFNSYILSLL